ncbi:hybrid sensor histidine kinase/response regulator [Pinirhizobacter sp.]|uniref:hybrid sensor histidine kinase/response regulator n=1 Tax=Pinirhizobacter sp. TaxID=2950432 RepID=UPI002F3F22C2
MARWILAGLLACLCLAGVKATDVVVAASADAAVATQHKMQFRHFTMADGLPSRKLRSVVQDTTGYLWIGSDAGLARFDGVEFDVFRREAGVAGSIGGNRFDALMVDRAGRVWAGGIGSGLSRRNADGSFTTWRHVEGEPRSLADDDVQALAAGIDGEVWIGTRHRGLFRLRPEGGWPEPEVFSLPDTSRPGPGEVNALHMDAQGVLWMGGAHGLGRRDAEGRWTWLDFPDGPPPVIHALDVDAGGLRVASERGLFVVSGDHLQLVEGTAGLSVTASLRDSRGTLWIALTGAGLLLLEPGGQTAQVSPRPFLPHGLPGRHVVRLLEDREGGIWCALTDGGLAYVGPGWGRFFLLTHVPDETIGLPHRAATAVARARNGEVWVGGMHGWVARMSVASEAVRERLPDVGARVDALLEAVDGTLWIGTARGLMVRRPGEGVASMVAGPTEAVTGLVESPSGTVYASTRNSGVWKLGPGQARASTLAVPGSGIHDDTRQLLMVGASPWRAGSNGVQWIAPGARRFEPVPGIDPGAVDALAISGDDLWVAREDSLQRYRWGDGHAVKRQSVDQAAGWPRTDVLSIGVGPRKHVWGLGVAGLWTYAPETGEAMTLGLTDGLFSAEFTDGTTAVLANGVILGATLDGVLGFDPSAPVSVIPAPPIALRSISIRRDNQRIDLPLDGRPLHLGWRDRDLTIQVRALSFVDGEANRYRFRLDGQDESWIDTGHRDFREFAQLGAGRHLLWVEGAAPHGPWGALRTPLEVIVERPPWTRAWAWMAYIGAACLLVWIVVLRTRRAMDRRMQVRLARQARQLAEEANDAKTNFVGVLGHELRTPMTGVLGMAELLASTPLTTVQAGYVRAMRQSGRLLLRLLDNVLDLTRLGLARLELENATFDPAALMVDTVAFERPLATTRSLQLLASLPPSGLRRRVGDEARVRQILLNLISNAVKFTEHGHVAVSGYDGPAGLVFTVADTGPGIAAHDRERLFGRYEQARTPQSAQGFGLGLAICRELATLMGGGIELDSTPGHGSIFTVCLPLPAAADDGAADDRQSMGAIASARRVLLVEDDATVAAVIAGLLRQSGHAVTCASHALDAMGCMEDAVFDVVLLDLDLPGIDGFGLARWLGLRQPSLPVIAVSARSMGDEEERVAAAGMQGFARKPVDAVTLQRLLASLE